MKKNLSNADRTIRVFAAIVIAVLILTGTLTGTGAWILGIFAAVFALTSFFGLCPLYLAIGLSTLKARPGK